MSYYGGGQSGADPNQQQPSDPYLDGQGGYSGQAPVDPYAGQPAQPPADSYAGQAAQPPADPYYGMPSGDPYAQPQQQQPPPPGWQQPPPGQWPQPPAASRSSGSNAGAVLVGIFLVLLGVWFLFRDEIALDFGQLWPAAAVALGLVMVVAAFIPRRRQG